MTLIALLILLSLFVVLIFVVVSLTRSRNAGLQALGWLLLIIPPAVILLFGMYFSVAYVDTVVTRPLVSSAPPNSADFEREHEPASGTRQITVTSDATWAEAADGPFDASIYASAESAGRALGRKMIPIIEQMIPKQDVAPGQEHVDVEVGDVGPFSSESIRSEVVGVLREKLPDYTVSEKSDAPESPAPNSISVVIGLPERVINQPLWRDLSNKSEVSGTLRAQIQSANESRSCSVHVVDKPWVDSLDRVIAQSGRNLIVARSPVPAGSQDEARRTALRDARQKLVTMEYSPQWIDNALTHNSIMIDQFSQKLSRPYGDVWRTALLLDLSADRTAQISASVSEIQNASSRHTLSLLGSMLGLGLLATGLYFLLDFLTRGFYRVRVSVIVAVVTLGGLAMLWIA